MGLGDEIMVTGRARVMQLADPRKVRVTYQGRPQWSAIFDNNPRIARLNEQGDFQILQARGQDNHRPYHTGKTPQKWIYNLNFRADVGEIYFTPAESEFAAKFPRRVIIEPNIKPKASPNKQWGWARWQKLADLMNKTGIRPSQIGPEGANRLCGAEFIHTQNFRMAAAVVSLARGCVFPEGGLHHAAAACNVPAVVIFGGFTPVELTGYPMHRNLGVSLDGACGMRLPCRHCADEMARIEPEQVLQQLKEIMLA